MADRAVVGVDPGSRNVGLVVRQGQALLRGTVLVRDDEPKIPGVAWLREVRSVVQEYRTVACQADPEFLLAIEGLNDPIPQMGIVAVAYLIGTAMVFGDLVDRYPGTVVVPPGKNGAGPLEAYPPPLRLPPKARTKHARSAWDVAGAAPTLARWLAAPATPGGTDARRSAS